MKIAIISDSHDNIPNIEKALKWINKEGIRTIIHCGDLCAPSIMNHVFLQNFDGEIHFVHGNVGGNPEELEELAKKNKNLHLYNWRYSFSDREMNKKEETTLGYGEIEIDDKHVAFTHSPDDAKVLVQTGQYNYVFYGHTHRPWIEQISNDKHPCFANASQGEQIQNKSQISNSNDQNMPEILNHKSKIVNLVNPGTLAGMFYKATFAVLDTDKNVLELKILERLN